MELGIALFVGMLALVLLGVPIGFALLVTSFGGAYFVAGWPYAFAIFTEAPRQILSTFSYSVAPMFILMGALAAELGLVERAYRAARLWLSFSRGGVLVATLWGGAIFGAISGSSIASAAFFSKTTMPEIRKYGYDLALGSGTIAAAGSLATLIPPSIMMVIYAILTEVSVGRILIGGIIPGIVLTTMMSSYAEAVGWLRPKLVPTVIERASMKERASSLAGILPIGLTFIVLFGGIYTGFFTPTAAGAISVIVVLLIGLARRIRLTQVISSLKETLLVTCQVFFVVWAGITFSRVIVLSGFLTLLIEAITVLPGPLTVIVIIVIYIIAGCLLDPVSMLVILAPFTTPILSALGFLDIQIAIVNIILVEVAVITPPVGFNCYVVASSAGIPPETVFRGMVPYFVILLVMIALLLIFPWLAEWLPGAMFA